MKVIVSLIEVFCMKHSPGFQALKIIFFFFFAVLGGFCLKSVSSFQAGNS